jgi:hypothetical protein
MSVRSLLGAVLLLASTLLAQQQLLIAREQLAPEEDLLYLPQPRVLSALSLGHRELAADLVFVRAVIYYGGRLQERAAPRWIENYLSTIVELDPAWRTPYRWAGVATMYDGLPITRDKVLSSSHYLALGTERFPNDWELPFMLGCNYLFELPADSPEEKERYRRIGAGYIQRAALLGGAPPWVPLLAASMLRKGGDDEAAVRHLESVFQSSTDEETRRQVLNRLRGMRSKLDLEAVERARTDFERGWQQTAPYAPPGLYALIGIDRPRRAGLRALLAPWTEPPKQDPSDSNLLP